MKTENYAVKKLLKKKSSFFSLEREDPGDIGATMSREGKSCQLERDQLDLRAQQ